jgi:hypothetical protein
MYCMSSWLSPTAVFILKRFLYAVLPCSSGFVRFASSVMRRSFRLPHQCVRTSCACAVLLHGCLSQLSSISVLPLSGASMQFWLRALHFFYNASCLPLSASMIVHLSRMCCVFPWLLLTALLRLFQPAPPPGLPCAPRLLHQCVCTSCACAVSPWLSLTAALPLIQRCLSAVLHCSVYVVRFASAIMRRAFRLLCVSVRLHLLCICCRSQLCLH